MIDMVLIMVMNIRFIIITKDNDDTDPEDAINSTVTIHE